LTEATAFHNLFSFGNNVGERRLSVRSQSPKNASTIKAKGSTGANFDVKQIHPSNHWRLYEIIRLMKSIPRTTTPVFQL